VKKQFRQLQGVERYPQRPRISQQIATPLLIAAGLIGVPLAIGLARRATEDDTPAVPAVDPNTVYQMNHHIPGAGYYHVPFHAWFPIPYNTFQPGRGWYRGGQWRPTEQPVAAEEQEQQSSAAGIRSSATYGSGFRASSYPSPAAVQRVNSGATAHHASTTTRGGFGSSAHFGGFGS
jgi:hypothetical protein